MGKIWLWMFFFFFFSHKDRKTKRRGMLIWIFRVGGEGKGGCVEFKKNYKQKKSTGARVSKSILVRNITF